MVKGLAAEVIGPPKTQSPAAELVVVPVVNPETHGEIRVRLDKDAQTLPQPLPRITTETGQAT